MWVENGGDYKILFGYTEDVSRFNYGIVHGSKTKIGNLIVGWNESQETIVVVPTVPDLSGCGDPTFYRRSDILKAYRNKYPTDAFVICPDQARLHSHQRLRLARRREALRLRLPGRGARRLHRLLHEEVRHEIKKRPRPRRPGVFSCFARLFPREEAEDGVGGDGQQHAEPVEVRLDEQVERGVVGHGQGQQAEDAGVEELLLPTQELHAVAHRKGAQPVREAGGDAAYHGPAERHLFGVGYEQIGVLEQGEAYAHGHAQWEQLPPVVADQRGVKEHGSALSSSSTTGATLTEISRPDMPSRNCAVEFIS